MKLLQARWIATMAGTPLRDGAVVFDEQSIQEVGPARELRLRHPAAVVHDAGSSLILPGLVNAHAHLELTGRARPPSPGGSLAEWLRFIIISTGRMDQRQLAEAVGQSVDAGVGQCLRFGVTAVGDITRHCALTRPLLARSPLRVVSFGEVQALGQRRGLLDERLAAALDDSHSTQRLVIGLTPHAPYTVEPAAYSRCLREARQRGLPLATHLAETADEQQFLARHTGTLRELWDWLGWWDEQVPRFEGGPIRLAQSTGLLDYPTVLAHVNCCDDEELAILAAGRASVVYNPRTHAYFNHPPHRWRQMLEMGINVAVGTDSCASSPDLNLVDELATVRAARALGLSRSGMLAPGMSSDLAVFGVDSDRPLEEVLEGAALPAETWIGGQRAAP
jgi:aminodeoxyfutalosine deaminase